MVQPHSEGTYIELVYIKYNTFGYTSDTLLQASYVGTNELHNQFLVCVLILASDVSYRQTETKIVGRYSVQKLRSTLLPGAPPHLP